MRRTARLPLALLLLVAAGAAQNVPADANAPRPIRIGVALLKNTSRRPIAVQVQRDHLVRAINEVNRKDDAKKGRAKLEAVPLDANSAPEAVAQARDKHCDFIVYTNLTDLRQAGDPNTPVGVGVGGGGVTMSTPLGAPPPQVAGQSAYAIVDFRLQRVGSGQPLLDSSVSATESMDTEATVTLLLAQIADRVGKEVRKTGPRETD